MRVYGAILPGAAHLARLPAELSETAKRRFKVILWYQEHGGKVRLTARHFGFSPDTISRWGWAYRAHGVAGLEPRSRRPRRVRQPQTSLAVVQRIRALREQYPRWGREKLRVLLAREGVVISAKTPILSGQAESPRSASGTPAASQGNQGFLTPIGSGPEAPGADGGPPWGRSYRPWGTGSDGQ